MSYLMDALHLKNDHYQKIIEICEKNIPKDLQGKLRVSGTKSYPRYYLNIPSQPEHYLTRDQRPLAQALAQKEYAEALLKKVYEEKELLDHFLGVYDPKSLERFFYSLPESRQLLVTPIIRDDEAFIEHWYGMAEACANPRSITRESPTKRGEITRSKTEADSADTYFYYKVPYQYETKLFLKNFGTVYPDFRLLNVRLRKTIYHEHFGMMDDPEYRRDTLRKINAYTQNNFIQGQNIFYTFETKDQPFTAQMLEPIVKSLLL